MSRVSLVFHLIVLLKIMSLTPVCILDILILRKFTKYYSILVKVFF